MQNVLTGTSKELVVEALTELMRSHRGEFIELLSEAFEDGALRAAIAEGRKDDFVSEEEIHSLLRTERYKYTV